MSDKFSHSIEDEKHLKKLAYEIMNEVDAECRGRQVPLEKRNIAVLNGIRDYYVKRFGLEATSSRKPNVQSLSRDKEIFGNRPVNVTNLVPSADPYQRKPGDFDISRIIESRDEQIGIAKKPTETSIASTKETAEDNDAFMRRFRDFEDSRRELEKNFETQQQIQQQTEPQAMAMAPAVKFAPTSFAKHVTIASQDRSWSAENSPYAYAAVFGETHRNVESIVVSELIIPESDLRWPYLMLEIREFENVCDGTNDAARRCFCKMTVDKIVSVGDRRYAVLVSDSIARRTRVAELSKLNLSFSTPLGTPVESAGGKVESVRAASIAGSRVKIVVSGDGDYRIGDVVLFRGCEADKRAFSEFLNRQEGHRVVGVDGGDAFYVEAPLDGARDGAASKGYLLNAMLQSSVSLRIEFSGS